MTSKQTYETATIRLHWISAVLILGLLALGLWMVELNLESDTRSFATRAHVAGGLTCLFVTLWRFVARLRSQAPPSLPVSRSHLIGIKTVHVLQYGVLVGLLASGVGLLILGGLKPALVGEVPLPDLSDLPPRGPHGVLSRVFIGLLIAHVGGSVIYQLQRGQTFERMGFRRPSGTARDLDS